MALMTTYICINLFEQTNMQPYPQSHVMHCTLYSPFLLVPCRKWVSYVSLHDAYRVYTLIVR
jgi:hypothetical protein